MGEELATQRKDIRDWITGMKDQFALALPRLLTPERFLRVALTCLNKNPKLANCTRDSLLACLLDCAALGIEPDGRRAHLIPYGDKCTLIIDYKGIAELVRRSGEVSDLHSDVICEQDDFDYMFGTGSFLRHKINIRKPRGAVVGAYSYVKLKDGAESFDVMGVDEIETVRKRSRAANNGPWVTDKAEMQKKTVFRRHSKWLPLSPELRDQLEKDDEPLTEQERFASARPVEATPIQFGDAGIPQTGATGVTGAPPEEKKRGRPKKEPETGNPMQPGPTGITGATGPTGVPAPPRATPLEGLRNLMVGSKIEEAALLTHLFSQNFVEQGDKLETLPEGKIAQIIANWAVIVADIRGE